MLSIPAKRPEAWTPEDRVPEGRRSLQFKRNRGRVDHGRWCWPFRLDDYLYGLVDEFAECLGEPFSGVAHPWRPGSSVR